MMSTISEMTYVFTVGPAMSVPSSCNLSTLHATVVQLRITAAT